MLERVTLWWNCTSNIHGQVSRQTEVNETISLKISTLNHFQWLHKFLHFSPLGILTILPVTTKCAYSLLKYYNRSKFNSTQAQLNNWNLCFCEHRIARSVGSISDTSVHTRRVTQTSLPVAFTSRHIQQEITTLLDLLHTFIQHLNVLIRLLCMDF